MKVILTHEQADMDALASQLGAWLLFPDALPLLPRNINRNGRRFLQTFDEDLPFLTYEDLPREDIEVLILVDTQSMITLKGMSEETRVIVYDHHPLRDDLDPDWELRCGLAYDETPVADMKNRTPRIPDADRIWTSAGFGYKVCESCSIDFGYTHIMIHDAEVNHVYDPSTGATINGEYEGDVDIFSLQLNWKI